MINNNKLMRANEILQTSLSVLAVTAVMSSFFAVQGQGTSDSVHTIEEVVVTGSYIKGTPGDAALPVQILDRGYIDRIGANTIADVISKLAISSGAENFGDSFTQNAGQGTSNINLRGLGLSSTLVLINGRRQTISGGLANDGSVYVDTSTIPVDALERVEILKEGAASTYGSDAIAGVANFILRKNFEGFEVNGGLQVIEDGGQRDLDVGFVYGGGSDATSFLLSGHYFDRTAMNSSERPEISDNATSGLGKSYLLLAPSIVASGPYAGTYGAFENVAISDCGDFDGDLVIPQAFGTRCGFDFGPRFNLIKRETRSQIYGNIMHEFDSDITLFADVGYSSNNVSENPQSPSFPDLTFPVISGAAPGNPFGVPFVFLGRPLGPEAASPDAPRENDTLRASIELTGEFGNGWDWNTALTYSKNKYFQSTPDTIASRFTAAINGVGGPNNDETFSIFDRTANSQSVIDDFSTNAEATLKTDLLVLDGVVSGDLFQVPAGDVGFAFGFQARAEGYSVDPNDINTVNFDTDGNPIPVDMIFLGGRAAIDVARESAAAFMEVKFPVTDDLELTTALRYERLQNADSLDPKVALRWQVTDGIALRGSFSTAFREPSLSQQHSRTVALANIQDLNADGTLKGNPVFRRVSATGSTDLKPEQSTNYNIGVIFQPTDGLDIKVDFWGIKYTDLITIENAQAKLAADPNGPDIIRDTLGNLGGINVDFFNSSKVTVQGLDLDINWAINDAWTAALNMARFTKYEITDPSGAALGVLGSFNNNTFARSLPKTKGNFNLAWQGETQSASVNVSYVSSYENDIPVPATESSKIDSFVTVDAQYSIALDFGLRSDSKTILTFGIKNLLDEDAPRVYVPGNFSFDPKQHNPFGRIYYMRAKYSF